MTVICLFERRWPDVKAVAQLSSFAFDLEGTGIRRHRLVLYDNSAASQAESAAAIADCTYFHDPANGGTAAAYEFATKLALQDGADWLLLLDHDSVLPAGFFTALARSRAAAASEPVAAFVPWVVHESRVVSPAFVTIFGSIRPLSRRPVRPESGHALTAIASGSVLRVSVLGSLLPLPQGLWLDYVDHWIFARIRARGGIVRIFDATVEHDLSIARPASLSRRRLISVLEGEARFVASLGRCARWVHPLRLARRLVRYLVVRPRLGAWMAGWMLARTAR